MQRQSSSKKPDKRSPFPRKSLPQAGESLRDAILEDVATKLMMSAAMAVSFGVVAICEWGELFTYRRFLTWIWTLFALGLGLYALCQFFRIRARLRTEGLGIRGERHVGRLLEEARKHGYIPFHDIPGDNFNVDHALVGPGGVFAIETKTRSKRTGKGAQQVDYDGKRVLVDGHEPERDPIAQAEGSARHLQQILKNMTGHTVDVRPVVLFPTWWVNEPREQPRVWVLNEKRLFSYLKNEPRRLSDEDIALYVHRLELHLTRE
jgi:hypothetical protein